MSDRQVSAGALLQSWSSSPGRLATVAAACLLLAAVLPVVTLSANLGGEAVSGVRSIGGGSTSSSGAAAAGVLGWLAVLAFVGAAASRFVHEMAPYKRGIDLMAFGVLGAAVAWAFTDGPVAEQVRTTGQVSQMFQGFSKQGAVSAGMPALSVNILPSLGALFVALAPLALILARRRETALRSRFV